MYEKRLFEINQINVIEEEEEAEKNDKTKKIVFKSNVFVVCSVCRRVHCTSTNNNNNSKVFSSVFVVFVVRRGVINLVLTFAEIFRNRIRIGKCSSISGGVYNAREKK